MCRIVNWLVLFSTCFGVHASAYADLNVLNNNSQIMVEMFYPDPDEDVRVHCEAKLVDLEDHSRIELVNYSPNNPKTFFTISKELTQHIKDLQQKLFQKDIVFPYTGVSNRLSYLSPAHILIRIKTHRDPNTSEIKNHYEAQTHDFQIIPALKRFKYQRQLTTLNTGDKLPHVSVKAVEYTQHLADANITSVSISDLITQIKNSQTTFMVSSDSFSTVVRVGSYVNFKGALHPRMPYDDEHDLFAIQTNVPITILGLEKLTNQQDPNDLGSWFVIFIPSKILKTPLYPTEIGRYLNWTGIPAYRAPLGLLYEQLYKANEDNQVTHTRLKNQDDIYKHNQRVWDKDAENSLRGLAIENPVTIDPNTLDCVDVTELRELTSMRNQCHEGTFDFLERVYLSDIVLKPTQSDSTATSTNESEYSEGDDSSTFVPVEYDPKSELYTVDKKALLQALDSHLEQYETARSMRVSDDMTNEQAKISRELFSCKSVFLEER